MEVPGRVVVFVDEIDTTFGLAFSDDFFAAVRAIYNLRATEPPFQRIGFVLLGVAAPADLIKAKDVTPFNIGQAIDLTYLSRTAAGPLERGLEDIAPGRGGALLDQVFLWTSGHPYQTQRICAGLAACDIELELSSVDSVARQLFLTADASDDSLKTVERIIQAQTERGALLRLYRNVYNGRRVSEDRRSVLQLRLLLTGLVRAVNGQVEVANKIYRQVFDRTWVRRNMPVDQTMLTIIVSMIIIAASLGGLVLFRDAQTRQTISSLSGQYRDSADNGVRVALLVSLCEQNSGGMSAAQNLFFVETKPPQVRRQLAARLRDLPPEGRRTFQSCICDQVAMREAQYRERQDLARVCPRSDERGRP